MIQFNNMTKYGESTRFTDLTLILHVRDFSFTID